jgi:hypothetical protein
LIDVNPLRVEDDASLGQSPTGGLHVRGEFQDLGSTQFQRAVLGT